MHLDMAIASKDMVGSIAVQGKVASIDSKANEASKMVDKVREVSSRVHKV